MTRILSGVVDQGFYFVAVDATDFTTPETGLATWTVYRSRNGAAEVLMTTPTITEIDATNMPGVYFLLCDEDMTLDAGDDEQEMCFRITHAGMAPVVKIIELSRPKGTAGNTHTVAATGEGAADVLEINGQATSAVNLALSSGGILPGTVDTTVAATTTEFEAADITEATADHFNGRIIIFTSGALQYQACSISDYALSGGKGHFTVSTLTEAPSNGDTFIIV